MGGASAEVFNVAIVRFEVMTFAGFLTKIAIELYNINKNDFLLCMLMFINYNK